METILTIQEKQRVEDLFSRIANLIETSRARVVTAVNVAEVYTKYEIGRYIIEDEQGGSIRAQYGKKVLKELSQRLTNHFGDSGWSVENLKLFRRFYLVYSNSVTSGYPNLTPMLLLPHHHQRYQKDHHLHCHGHIMLF